MRDHELYTSLPSAISEFSLQRLSPFPCLNAATNLRNRLAMHSGPTERDGHVSVISFSLAFPYFLRRKLAQQNIRVLETIDRFGGDCILYIRSFADRESLSPLALRVIARIASHCTLSAICAILLATSSSPSEHHQTCSLKDCRCSFAASHTEQRPSLEMPTVPRPKVI